MLIFGLGNVHVLCIHASRTPSIHHRRETLDLSVFGDLDIPQSACNGTIHGNTIHDSACTSTSQQSERPHVRSSSISNMHSRHDNLPPSAVPLITATNDPMKRIRTTGQQIRRREGQPADLHHDVVMDDPEEVEMEKRGLSLDRGAQKSSHTATRPHVASIAINTSRRTNVARRRFRANTSQAVP